MLRTHHIVSLPNRAGVIISSRSYTEEIKVFKGFKKSNGFWLWILNGRARAWASQTPPRALERTCGTVRGGWLKGCDLDRSPVRSILMRNTAPSFWLLHELLQPYLRAWEMAQPLAAQAWGLEFVSTAATWMMAGGVPCLYPKALEAEISRASWL